MELSNNSSQFFRRGLLAVILVLALSSKSVEAQVIFDNGAANLANSAETFNADEGKMTGNIFTPTVSGTATTINFAGYYFLSNTLPTSDSFTISLYAVTSSAPGTLISTSTVSGLTRSLVGTGGYNQAYSVYAFSGTLNTPFSLNAGTSYYLGISDATLPYEEFNVAYSSGSATSLFEGKVGLGQFVAEPNSALSFSLVGPTETPTLPPWGYVILGLLLLFIAAKSLQGRNGSADHFEPLP